MDIAIVRGDITTAKADAIVNAANSTLLGGGGVDGAIHAAAGPGLLEECRRLREESLSDGLPAGHAVITSAHDLPAQWVVHAVGPNRNAGETDIGVLESAFRSALDAADRVGAHSVAVPAIGAGDYGWPAVDVAAAAHRAIVARGNDVWDNVVAVTFVVSGEDIEDAFRAEFDGGHGETTGDGAGA